MPATRMPERRRSPWLFFSLVFAMSAPFWLIGAASNWQPMPGVPASGLMVFCPCLAAALLAYRERGMGAIATLFKRSFDHERITIRIWLLPILFLMPAVLFISYSAMRLLNLPVTVTEIDWRSVVPLLFVLFLAALGEELGWSGYVIDPLQRRWGALGASLILGSVWAVWHLIPLQQAGRATNWIAWWCLATVALRILHTWLYNNTGKSVFGAILFHASANVSWQLFPNGGAQYDPRITGLILAAAAAIAVRLGGPSRLTRHADW